LPARPEGVSATVKSAGDGFDVEIKSADAAGGEEVLRRAKSLTSE
jgi:hypothetical protein